MLNASLQQFKNKKGYLSVETFTQNGKDIQKFFTCNELQEANNYIKNISGDCYNSKATFKTPVRRKGNLDTNIYELTCYFIDIDNHLNPFTKLEAISFLNTNLKPLFDISIPTPSKVIFSGRGLHIHYYLTGASDVKLWERTQRALTSTYDSIVSKYDTLATASSGLGVDYSTNNANGIIRTIGTFNTKGNCFSEVIYSSGETYTQQDFTNYDNLTYAIERGKHKGELVKLSEFKGLNKQQVLEATQREVKEFKQFKKEYTKETLNLARREDLFKIIEMRNVLGVSEGYRNNLIKIAIQLLRENTNDIQMLLLQVNEYNQAFKMPLQENEVIGWLNSGIKKQYYFSNKKIIELLGLSIDEQKQLVAIISRKVKNNRYYLHNSMHLKELQILRYKPIKEANREAKEQVKLNAKALQEQGLKVPQIASQLGVSKRTIFRYLKG